MRVLPLIAFIFCFLSVPLLALLTARFRHAAAIAARPATAQPLVAQCNAEETAVTASPSPSSVETNLTDPFMSVVEPSLGSIKFELESQVLVFSEYKDRIDVLQTVNGRRAGKLCEIREPTCFGLLTRFHQEGPTRNLLLRQLKDALRTALHDPLMNPQTSATAE